MERYHYGIKIGDEVFNYYGSANEFEYTQWKIKAGLDANPMSLLKKKYGKFVAPTNEEIKRDALYALVNDYFTYDEYTMDEFVDEFVDEFEYKASEWIRVYNEINIIHNRMDKLFTRSDMKLLQELYQDF